jgi:cell division protein FtsB
MLEDLARKYGIVVLFLTFIFTVLFCPNGVFDYISLKREVTTKQFSIRKMEVENVLLKARTERMQHDDRYIEDVARSKFGFIKDGEKVYRIEK